MTDVLLATNNAHKREEMEGILKLYGAPVRLVQPGEIGFSFDTSEDGRTFAANALQKAHALFSLVRGRQLPGVTCKPDAAAIAELCAGYFGAALPPVLADDSGISVDALEGAPGIYSARFGDAEAGRKLTDGERNTLLLSRLESAANRSCHYVCHAILLFGEDQSLCCEARWDGRLRETPAAGETGFGYDPIVTVADSSSDSVAMMSQDQKNLVSHRAQAIRAIARAAAWV